MRVAGWRIGLTDGMKPPTFPQSQPPASPAGTGGAARRKISRTSDAAPAAHRALPDAFPSLVEWTAIGQLPDDNSGHLPGPDIPAIAHP
jgi:hypothetical protein